MLPDNLVERFCFNQNSSSVENTVHSSSSGGYKYLWRTRCRNTDCGSGTVPAAKGWLRELDTTLGNSTASAWSFWISSRSHCFSSSSSHFEPIRRPELFKTRRSHRNILGGFLGKGGPDTEMKVEKVRWTRRIRDSGLAKRNRHQWRRLERSKKVQKMSTFWRYPS